MKILPYLGTLAFTLVQKGFSLDWSTSIQEELLFLDKISTKALQRQLVPHVLALAFPIDPCFNQLEPGNKKYNTQKKQKSILLKSVATVVGQISGFFSDLMLSHSSAESTQKMVYEVWSPCHYQGELWLPVPFPKLFPQIHLFSPMALDKLSVACFVEKPIYGEALIGR